MRDPQSISRCLVASLPATNAAVWRVLLHNASGCQRSTEQLHSTVSMIPPLPHCIGNKQTSELMNNKQLGKELRRTQSTLQWLR